MAPIALKDARMELKTTSDAKDLLIKAAMLDGMDVSAFVIASAVDRARAVLVEHAAIKLSAAGQERLASLLHAQASPTENMKKLRSLARIEVREA